MNLLIVIAAAAGYLIGGWGGLLVAVTLAYLLRGMLRNTLIPVGIARMQSQFLETTFAVMGAVCKADGRVSADEIGVAERLFERLHLPAAARETAKAAFTRGKAPDFDLDAEVARFAQASRGQRVLHQMFLQIQLSALAADGRVHPAEHEMLLRIARGLGMSEAELVQLEAMLGAAPATAARQSLDDAYRVLGIDPAASDAEIKKAYRRLMSQHHPDKLASKGLPESMRALAEEKTREITSAYERIERARAQARPA